MITPGKITSAAWALMTTCRLPCLALFLATGLGCSPAGPSQLDAEDAVQQALGEELAEPYAILALKLASDDNSRRQLEKLGRRLYRIDSLSIRNLEQSPLGIWQGFVHAEISCAMAQDDELLDRREATALAMAYRSICAKGFESASRQIDRRFTMDRRGGLWVADIDPTVSTKR